MTALITIFLTLRTVIVLRCFTAQFAFISATFNAPNAVLARVGEKLMVAIERLPLHSIYVLRTTHYVSFNN